VRQSIETGKQQGDPQAQILQVIPLLVNNNSF
jgi:hypothetical protein